MLGDRPLAGIHQYTIDAKGRMFLPACTGRENGEFVYLVYDSELEKYALYSQKVLDAVMEKLDVQIDDAKTPEELKFRKEKLLSFSMNVSGPFKVDSQGRICLRNKLNYEGSINIIGAYNRLILEIPEEDKKKTLGC